MDDDELWACATPWENQSLFAATAYRCLGSQNDAGPTPHTVRINLGALALAEERGDWAAIGAWVTTDLFARMERYADSQLRDQLSGIRQRLAVAQKYEAHHGIGSLLVLDHPFNIRMAQELRAQGKPWPPPAFI
jgi:hypothetical protein